MVNLTKAEKEELLKSAKSKSLRRDSRRMRENRDFLLSKIKNGNVDKYIKFLSFCGKFMNYKQRPFRKIKGSKFKI